MSPSRKTGLQSIEMACVWGSGSLRSHYVAEGAAISVPGFGQNGVIILLDGKSSLGVPINDDEYHAEITTDFSKIRVYDFTDGMVYTQTATTTGFSLPKPRVRHCAVGVADAEGNFDIFMFGGTGPSTSPENDYLEDLSSVHVLSLPAFRWHNVAYDGRRYP